jgi:hypothetical protein
MELARFYNSSDRVSINVPKLKLKLVYMSGLENNLYAKCFQKQDFIAAGCIMICVS